MNASTVYEGNAIVYCEGAFNTTYGKTAHGLVRFTRRYRVLAVIDSRYAGEDAGAVLDGAPAGIPVMESLAAAVERFRGAAHPASCMVIGLATDGGVLDAAARAAVAEAIDAGLHVDSGLHDFITEDPSLTTAAAQRGVRLRDIRKPPPRGDLHFFSGRIETVASFRIAVLGTDSAVGKRTTAWRIADALSAAGVTTQMIGTGQTAWLQGVRYGIVMDTLINDFVSGEIEDAVWRAWEAERPRAMVLEGQGSLLNPAYPGGFELLAAGRPHAVVLQHAPARREYDGFPGYPIHPIDHQIRAVEIVSGRPVVAITVNHEGLEAEAIADVCRKLTDATGLPAVDVLTQGAAGIVDVIEPLIAAHERKDG